jgi:hypothetical protein
MSNEAITDRGPRPRLQRHVAAAADALLAKGTSVAPVDVLMGIGWLPASVVDAWRRGRAECLDLLAPVSPDKLGAALQHLRRWAGTGLVPSEVTYLAVTHDRRALRFTADGDQATERAWRAHWTRSDLTGAARQREIKAPSLVSASGWSRRSATSPLPCHGPPPIVLSSSPRHGSPWCGGFQAATLVL